MKNEYILAVNKNSVDAFGFKFMSLQKIERMFFTNFVIASRCKLETDNNFKQVIPYIIVRRGDSILMYERTKMSGEERLHLSNSIGFGGHVESDNIDWYYDEKNITNIDLASTVYNSSARELKEEINLRNLVSYDFNWVGVINDDSTEVNAVHVGIVGVVDAPEEFELSNIENHLTNVRWVPIKELYDNPGESDLELWSKLCINRLHDWL